MMKTCQKCGHMNAAATGDELETCPECGAIYSRVAAAMAAHPAAMQRATARALSSRVPARQQAPEADGITQRQVMGFVGAAVLAIGVFMPLLSGPFGLSVNYFSNGQGDGVFVLAMAVCSAVLALVRRYRLLWVTGGLSAGMLVFTFVRLQSRMSQAKAQMEQSLQGNPFRGLADVAMQSMQMQWGWAVLAIGAVLILACAAMKKG